jgi:uncharacterized Fe-S cluster protein YjdI
MHAVKETIKDVLDSCPSGLAIRVNVCPSGVCHRNHQKIR